MPSPVTALVVTTSHPSRTPSSSARSPSTDPVCRPWRAPGPAGARLPGQEEHVTQAGVADPGVEGPGDQRRRRHWPPSPAPRPTGHRLADEQAAAAEPDSVPPAILGQPVADHDRRAARGAGRAGCPVPPCRWPNPGPCERRVRPIRASGRRPWPRTTPRDRRSRGRPVGGGGWRPGSVIATTLGRGRPGVGAPTIDQRHRTAVARDVPLVQDEVGKVGSPGPVQ